MTGAQALVRSLAMEGVEAVFAVPDVQIMDVFDALESEPGIRLVTVRHEQATAYMGDGYARATGKVGVALVVPGPGALNAAAGLGTAYATSSPVLLISGQVESYNLGKDRGVARGKRPAGYLPPLTKWCARVTQVDEIPGAVHRAMGYLRTGRPRPVELEIPWDVLPSSGEVELPEPEVYSKGAPDPARIKEAAELLAHARRPLIWAGGGTMAAEASREVVELATAINAPVVTTQQAKGIIPEDHPLSLGAYYYGHCPGYRAMARADVILAVGSRLHVVPSVPWAFQPHQVVVHIDADPAELGRNVPTRVAIEADARLGLQALLSELGGSRTKSEWAPGEASAARDEGYRRFKEMAPAQVGIVQALRRELEDDAIVVSGITTIGYWSNLVFPVLRPRSYLTSSYFATLGFAFPTAIGAKIGSPGRQVVALCGDGGFMYGVAELATAVQEGVNVVALVFNNAAFGASLRDQETRFGGRVYGTRLHNPDFPRLVEAFGATGIRISHLEELGEGLRSALATEGPVVVEVPIPVLDPPFQIPPPGMP